MGWCYVLNFGGGTEAVLFGDVELGLAVVGGIYNEF